MGGWGAKLKALAKEFLGPPPIYVFQMGKVGSCSVVDTLSQCWPGRVVHAHGLPRMSPEGRACLEFRQRFRLPILVVTPIREPIGRNVSAFFQNFERDVGVPFEARNWTLGELRQLFLERYAHLVPLEWFDRRFRPTFGIDVYASDFPRQTGWRVYRHESVKALVYRTDLDHAEQLQVLSDFLGLKLDRWVLANEAASKPYAAVYRQFCAEISLPEIYCHMLSQSRFARHFWPEESIARFSDKWSESRPEPRGLEEGPPEKLACDSRALSV